MGAVTFSLRNFYDSAIEHVGIKSGLLIERDTFRQILLEKFEHTYLIEDIIDEAVRIRVEHIEDMLSHVRQRIGNLPQKSTAMKYFNLMNTYMERTGDYLTLATSPSRVSFYLSNNINYTINEIAAMIKEETNLPEDIALAVAHIGYERWDQSVIISSPDKWDKKRKLSDIYSCEINSEDENSFLEQKFLDYLAVNGHEIETIHWRNFERFCAEYFKRQGYHVILGPGTNDGGVDIRVFKDQEMKTPPDLLIQCKRFKKENKVSIETVKAFYTDVQFEDATNGLIATSSYIAPGGKAISNARNYNLKFAEAENVKNWGRKMWTYSTV